MNESPEPFSKTRIRSAASATAGYLLVARHQLSGIWFAVSGSAFKVWGSWFGVSGIEFRILELGIMRVSSLVFRSSGIECGVVEVQVSGFEFRSSEEFSAKGEW